MTNTKKWAFAAFLCLLPLIWPVCKYGFCWFLLLLASFNSIDRHVTQRSGLDKIPEVSQMEDFFGKGDHSVSGGENHFVPSGTNDIYQWSTDVYFGGRYQLTMFVNVEVDRDSSEVTTVVDLPKYILMEVERIDMSEGSPSISYDGSSQREFGAADWKKVVEAKGDFSVIGIQLRNVAPIPHFDALVKWSQLRSQQRYKLSE